jgi:CTP:molybdopterin cytidylyltransferase MocA
MSDQGPVPTTERTVAVVLAAGAGSRFEGGGHKLLAEEAGVPVLRRAVVAAVESGIGEVVVVAGAVDVREAVAGLEGVEVVEHADWASGQASSLRAGIAAAERRGADVVVVGLGDMPDVGPEAWRRVAAASGPLVTASFGGRTSPPVRLERSLWDELPTDGDEGARVLMRARPDLVSTVEVPGSARDVDRREDLRPAPTGAAAADGSDADRDAVRALLGREPLAPFEVVVRRPGGAPIVIRNAPLLPDGRPMPTRYWLVDPELNKEIGRLESTGGVDEAERAVDAAELAAAHARYAAERDAALPDGHTGPAPSGGVGGTRTGVKCLHAHYAHLLATGDDPVGRWVAERLPPALAAVGRAGSHPGGARSDDRRPDNPTGDGADSGPGPDGPATRPPAAEPHEEPDGG